MCGGDGGCGMVELTGNAGQLVEACRLSVLSGMCAKRLLNCHALVRVFAPIASVSPGSSTIIDGGGRSN